MCFATDSYEQLLLEGPQFGLASADSIDTTAVTDGKYINLREYLSGTNPWDHLDLPALMADMDGDNDVDGSDLILFIDQLGRMDCATAGPCSADLDLDGDVDDVDLKLLAEDFGKISP